MATDTGQVYISAPNTTHVPNSGQVVGVTVRKGGRVDWHTRYNPDGTRVVTGYTITKGSK